MTAPNHNDERRIAVSAEIEAVAQGIISGQIGIVAGAWELRALRFEVGMEDNSDLKFFCGVVSETDHLPVGKARQYWNAEALRRKDEELRQIENSLRDRALAACRNLIRAHGK
jgi:hypothetical protein